MLTTVTSKGQVTIPKAIRDFLHVQPNDRVDFVVEAGQVVVGLSLRNPTPAVARQSGGGELRPQELPGVLLRLYA